jgi:hypothetical protein
VCGGKIEERRRTNVTGEETEAAEDRSLCCAMMVDLPQGLHEMAALLREAGYGIDEFFLSNFYEIVKSPTTSLRGAKRRACALKRYGAKAWQSHGYSASYENAPRP